MTVETPSENQIIAVEFDGQEIIQPPLSLAEHFAKQASRIDFNEVDEDIDEQGDDAQADSQEEEDASSQSGWPWESTRNKLKDALTELSVLQDVITICKHKCGEDPATHQPKMYMTLDGPVQKEPVESKPLISLLAKKKSLEAPAKILFAGAEQLKTLLQSKNGDQGSNKRPNISTSTGSSVISNSLRGNNPTSNKNVEEFYFELLRLRQNWRLKKVSNTILGDLSYRTAGSQFKQSGIFEVAKAADVMQTCESNSDMSSDSASGASLLTQGISKQYPLISGDKTKPTTAPKSALRVNVPSELEGIAFIQVVIKNESEPVVSTVLPKNIVTVGVAMSNDLHWQQKLEAAQNVIFCKELFTQLAREAIKLQAPVPYMVVENQITAYLFPDTQLLITLCHSTKTEGTPQASNTLGKSKTMSNSSCTPAQDNQPGDHSHVLEHSLHQLLRRVHKKNINPDDAGPSTAPAGISKRRRLAGPNAASRTELLEMAHQETMLEQIILQAQHVVLRRRTMFVLDTLAREIQDPLISCHLGSLSSPTRSTVKVIMMTVGYESILRTQLAIQVNEKQLIVVCKDGRILHFSHEPQVLRDFLLCQISQHQINGLQALAKCTGWQILSSSNHLGCGAVEPVGNAAGCLLQSSTANKFIAVRHSPQTQAAVFVSSAPCKNFSVGPIVNDSKWENLPEAFQEYKLEKMNGKNFLNKLELLMSVLSGSGGCK